MEFAQRFERLSLKQIFSNTAFDKFTTRQLS